MHTYKSKQYLFATLKVVVLFAALLFIYTKISNSTHFRLDIRTLFGATSPGYLSGMVLMLLLLSVFNWVFEILKWKVLISKIKKLSFFESVQQVLCAQTASLFTPAKLGEYGTKTLFYDSVVTKKVLYLNLVGNFAQLTATLFAGVFGVFYFVKQRFPEHTYTLISSILTIIITCLVFQKIFWKFPGFSTSFKNTFRSIGTLRSHNQLRVFGFSFLRYACFSLQFYLLIQLLHPVPFWETWLLIFAYYLISSALPVMQFLDLAVKSSVALWVFPHLNPAVILFITSWMWLLNTAGPAVVGTVFWWRLNPVVEKLKPTS